MITALFFGILNVFIIPPLQAPDEDVHFLCIWRFSSCSTNPYFSENKVNFLKMHHYLYFHPHRKYNAEKFKQALSYENRTDASSRDNGYFSYLKSRTIPYYLPAVIGMSISKFFSSNFCFNMWSARLFNLIAYCVIIFYAIKISPYFKWGFSLLGLMPMALFLASSMSYDSLSIAVCYWVTALMLKYFAEDRKINFRNNWKALCGIAFLALLKFPFYLITIPLLFLKKNKFEGNYRYGFKAAVLVLLLLHFGIAGSEMNLKKPSAKIYDRSFGAKPLNNEEKRIYVSPSEKLKILFTCPANFLNCFFNTLTRFDKILLYAASFGGCLGWLDTLLPPLLLSCFYLILLFSPLSETRAVNLRFQGRIIFLFTGLGIFVLLHIIFYISNLEMLTHIEGIQGRYFIPFAPLLLLPFLSGIGIKRLRKKRLSASLLFIGTVLVIQSASIITLLQRYYFTCSWIGR
ncbi:MAG: DUF2142 domain-containing protein [Victivallaceae bacterium]|nr:DUF2142 domain-containing protein [Victivallaceae bacterium]